MFHKLIISCLSLLFTVSAVTQNKLSDSTVDNLKLPGNYISTEYGTIPQYIKRGIGKKTLILIPGLGFDASVFNDFMKANENYYKMYAITIPGYGNTKAPAMPVTDTSYGLQYWNKGAETGIINLIEKEKINKPVIVAHFVQGTQLAFRLAIDYPEKIGGVIILGGAAKFIAVINGEPKEFDLKSTIAYVDKITAPQWFKHINKSSFDDGNYAPEIYSLNPDTAKKLWNMVASVSLPVMVRYLCEFFASDITLEINKTKCPVLILRATFYDTVLQKQVNNYVQPQFIDSWNKAMQDSKIIIKDVPDAATFTWKDNPEKTYAEIRNFVSNINKE